MQKSDPQIQCAKPIVMQLFADKYGRPKKAPYYIAQIQTILENNYFPWIIHQATNQLVEEKVLSKIETATKFHDKVVFLYNAKLDNPDFKHSLEAHVKSTCKLIDKYSEPSVCKAFGEHLEGLVKAELRAQGFKIIGTHTNKYKYKEWKQTGHDLDFIAEHNSSKLTIGVEVKNTIPIIERKEIDAKLDMCDFLGITPVFAVRWLKPYTKLIWERGGFSWIFKTQIYPPGFDELTKMLWKRLGLPVTVRTDLPEKSVLNFQRWVETNTR
jgi:hypothetical protein